MTRRIELSTDAHALLEYAVGVALGQEEANDELLRATDATYVTHVDDQARINSLKLWHEILRRARSVYIEF